MRSSASSARASRSRGPTRFDKLRPSGRSQLLRSLQMKTSIFQLGLVPAASDGWVTFPLGRSYPAERSNLPILVIPCPLCTALAVRDLDAVVEIEHGIAGVLDDRLA